MAGSRPQRPRSAATQLGALERVLHEFGGDAGARKFALLRGLAKARLKGRDAVLRLHEALCYLRALPDDERVLAQVTAMLAAFERRADFRACRDELADSGIAGTIIQYPFFAVTALWLSRRFPGALTIDWDEFEKGELLLSRLDLFALWGETPGLDENAFEPDEWVRRLAGPRTTDADFVIRRCAELGRTEIERERFYEEFELPLVLTPRASMPSRTSAHVDRPVRWQSTPLRRQRPDLEVALRQRAEVIDCDEVLGRRLVELAREAMVLRHRDLDAFAYGDPRDVRLLNCGDGLEFAVIGMVPERRLMLESVYAFLTLRNGVPIGYVLVSALFGSSEIAYNVFDTWRGGEAAWVYGWVLAVTQQLFGSDTFTIYPYQLGGGGNQEGLESGSWWFYQKLGFRARDRGVLRVMRSELAKMKRSPKHRTPIATLAEIAEHNVYWSAGADRDDIIGIFPLGEIGLRVTDYVARRFGADRELAERTCADEAAELCGVRGWQKWDEGERLAWLRWSPLVLLLPGVAKWSDDERAELVAVVRAKGGRRESDYVRRLDAHGKLRAALRRLAR
ncbi:MAG: hypothetical protein KDE27_27220 [Planctomycetes bacterium]|nr:hypothetical protein [Planctomycetota bacterium]